MPNKTKQQLLKDELKIIETLRDAFLESELADDQSTRIETISFLYFLEHTLKEANTSRRNDPKKLPPNIIDEAYRYRKVRNSMDVISMQGPRIDAGSRWVVGSFLILEDEDQFILHPYEPSKFEWDDLKK